MQAKAKPFPPPVMTSDIHESGLKRRKKYLIMDGSSLAETPNSTQSPIHDKMSDSYTVTAPIGYNMGSFLIYIIFHG